ncbi:MAG: hypothetical protein PHW95_02625 [Patescibacteria group bacterium]|nr:hypothetical protein [Patescibacteria group bacterium]
MIELSHNQQAILKTLAYFDIFDYPLTWLEIYRWLWQPSELYLSSDLLADLQLLISENIIEQKFGLYFLPQRVGIISVRYDRYQFAEKKFAIAKKVARWFSTVPFIEMIAVCNNVSYNNGSAKSDIDFFVVVKNGRLYFTRAIVTVLANALGLRRHGAKISNRVCLSFYIIDTELDLSDIAIADPDPYLIYWSATLFPIFNNDVYHKFLASNAWLKKYLPHFNGVEANGRRFASRYKMAASSQALGRWIFGGRLGDAAEKIARLIQLTKMSYNKKSVATQPNTKVVISERMLKFHENDRRLEYANRWYQSCANLKIL